MVEKVKLTVLAEDILSITGGAPELAWKPKTSTTATQGHLPRAAVR